MAKKETNAVAKNKASGSDRGRFMGVRIADPAVKPNKQTVGAIRSAVKAIKMSAKLVAGGAPDEGEPKKTTVIPAAPGSPSGGQTATAPASSAVPSASTMSAEDG